MRLGQLEAVKTMLISEFKAKCIGVLSEAQRTCEPVLVTRRGKPLARIEPVCDENPPPREFGKMKGEIMGDVVETDFSDHWESLQ